MLTDPASKVAVAVSHGVTIVNVDAPEHLTALHIGRRSRGALLIEPAWRFSTSPIGAVCVKNFHIRIGYLRGGSAALAAGGSCRYSDAQSTQ